jgi:hypothetical protein
MVKMQTDKRSNECKAVHTAGVYQLHPNTIVLSAIETRFLPYNFIPLNYHGYQACSMACFTVLMEDFTIAILIRNKLA